jgi:hypothetical protein
MNARIHTGKLSNVREDIIMVVVYAIGFYLVYCLFSFILVHIIGIEDD